MAVDLSKYIINKKISRDVILTKVMTRVIWIQPYIIKLLVYNPHRQCQLFVDRMEIVPW